MDWLLFGKCCDGILLQEKLHTLENGASLVFAEDINRHCAMHSAVLRMVVQKLTPEVMQLNDFFCLYLGD